MKFFDRSDLGIDSDVPARRLVAGVVIDMVPFFLGLGVVAALMRSETVSSGLGYLLGVVVAVGNGLLMLVVLRGLTGQSLGDRLVGVTYTDRVTGRPLGMRRATGVHEKGAADRGVRVSLRRSGDSGATGPSET